MSETTKSAEEKEKLWIEWHIFGDKTPERDFTAKAIFDFFYEKLESYANLRAVEALEELKGHFEKERDRFKELLDKGIDDFQAEAIAMAKYETYISILNLIEKYK